MHKLYDLKELLMKELEEHGSDKSLDMNSLKEIDTLAHATKNVCKIIECCEEGYSGYEGESYNDNYSGRMSRRAGGSYATIGRSCRRGRDAMGRFTSRAASGMIEELRSLMNEAPDEDTRHELSRLISKMEM